MEQSNTTKNIRWGVVLSYATLAISLIGSLFISNRVLRYIGDYNYGLYSFVGSITSWLTVLSSALIASYLRFASVDAKENGNVNKTNSFFFRILSFLGIGIITIGSVSLGYLYINRIGFGAYSWDDSVIIYLLFLLSIINIGLTFSTATFSQYINYNQRFIYDKGLALIVSICGFAAHFVIAKYTQSVVLLATYSIIASLATFGCNYIYCKKKLGIGFQKVTLFAEKDMLKAIVLFSSVLIVNSIVDQINSNVDKTLLGFFSIPENITIYQMGQLFQTYLASMITAVSSVFAPRIYNLCASGDQSGVNNLFLKISRLQGMMVCFVAFGFVSCGSHFIAWWLGDGYTAAYHVGAVLMLLSIMPLSVKLSIDVQRAKNLHKFRSAMFLIVAIFNVGLSIVFLNIFSGEYAVYACLLGTIISNIICQWVAMNIYNTKVIKLPMKSHYGQLVKYIVYGTGGLVTVTAINSLWLNGAHYSHLGVFFSEGTIYVFVFAGLVLVFDRNFILAFLKKR